MKYPRQRRGRVIALTSLLALAATACGGDDSASGTTAASDTTTPAATSAPDGGGTTTPISGEIDPAIQQLFIDAGYDWTDVDMSDVTIDIGQLIPRSGDFAFLGDAMLGGAELAASQIRAAGGPKIVFHTEDIGAGDPELSTAGARRLTADGIPVIQSSFGPATLAVVPIVEQSKTLLFQTAGATADQLSVSDYLWMGRPTATDPFPGLADYVIQQSPEKTKAAMMVWNEGSSLIAADTITGKWTDSGRDLTLQEVVDIGATDMGPSATRVASSGAEVVFLVVFGGDTSTAINALRDAGFEGQILGVDWNPGVTEATSGGDEGYLYVTDAQDATISDPFAQLYLTEYPKVSGAPIDVFSSLFWDNTVHIADLAVRAVRNGEDPNTSSSLIEELISDPSMPDSSAGTPVGWDVTTKAQTIKPHGLYEITGGTPKLIAIVQGGQLLLGKSLDDM